MAKEAQYDQVFVKSDQEENRKKFMREFCVKLCTALLPGKNQKQSCEGTEPPDEKAFARHVIFGNKAFSREVMDDLWEQEFDYRVKTLRARAKQLPYAQQAEMLKIYLIAMDEWILGLPTFKKRGKTKKPEAELQEMFAGLLKHRKKDCKNKGGLARYRVKNIKFKKQKLGEANNMDEAFAVLSRRGDNCNSDMLDEIRKPYLCELGNMKVPDFEQKYLDLYDYLTMSPKSDDEVKTYFVAAMRQWGQEKIDYCVVTNDPSPKQSPIRNSHIETLLYATAFSNINQFWDVMEQTRDFRIMYLAHQAARLNTGTVLHEKIQILESAKRQGTGNVLNNGPAQTDLCNAVTRILETVEDQIKTCPVVLRSSKVGSLSADLANSFIKLFESVGSYLGYEENSLVRKEKHTATAELFIAKARAAAEFFDRTEVFSYSEEEIAKMCGNCVEMEASPNGEISVDYIFEFVYPLLLGLLLQTFHQIATNCDAVKMRRLLMDVHRNPI